MIMIWVVQVMNLWKMKLLKLKAMQVAPVLEHAQKLQCFGCQVVIIDFC